jgi:dihydrofolate reductase
MDMSATLRSCGSVSAPYPPTSPRSAGLGADEIAGRARSDDDDDHDPHQERPVASLSYITNTSVDGFIEDADGRFDWAEPDDVYFAYMTELVRPVGTWLYGRRLYEAMAVWETDPTLAERSELLAEFARVWQSGEKVVHSTTLEAPVTERTRIERRFDPEAVRALKAASERDLTIGGAELAGLAFDAGLVDEVHLFVGPAAVGRGKPAFAGSSRVPLELLDEHRFPNGVVHLHYRTAT